MLRCRRIEKVLSLSAACVSHLRSFGDPCAHLAVAVLRGAEKSTTVALRATPSVQRFPPGGERGAWLKWLAGAALHRLAPHLPKAYGPAALQVGRVPSGGDPT
jgi:hypothetical protein